jgi:hypothetical protein
MDRKYLKTAIILVIVSLVTITAVFGLVFMAVRGASCKMEPSKPPSCSQEQAVSLAATLIKYSSTFTFDGIKDSVNQLKVETPDNGQTWKLLYIFKTAHTGHGDRGGQLLAQVITEHSVQITVTKCKIVSAICDKAWDLLKDQRVP